MARAQPTCAPKIFTILLMMLDQSELRNNPGEHLLVASVNWAALLGQHTSQKTTQHTTEATTIPYKEVQTQNALLAQSNTESRLTIAHEPCCLTLTPPHPRSNNRA